MSGFANRLHMGSFLNRSAYAGPRRFLVIGGAIAVVVAGVVVVSLSGSDAPPTSQVARLPPVNPLPGGLHSDPQMAKLALETDQEQADQAARTGQSYTPPIAPSRLVTLADNPPPVVAPVLPAPPPPATLLVTTPPQPAPVVQTVQYTPPPIAQSTPQPVKLDPQETQVYDDAVKRLLRGWDGRPPHTDVQIQPASATTDSGADDAGNSAAAGGRGSRAGAIASRVSDSSTSRGRLLLPAGRGIFAHTILSVSSDSDGPVILQADSGPIAGDRLIGTFGRATGNGSGSADRLVVRVNSIEHQGHSIGVDGIVTAPDTMETTVASSVDQHYMARFLLPAAAAFVQGLGQALATTSNTVGQLSPLGTTSYVTQLNFPQQVGVGAGAAAQQIGNTLNREAPTNPTVHLEANVSVGVMFLTDVIDTSNR